MKTVYLRIVRQASGVGATPNAYEFLRGASIQRHAIPRHGDWIDFKTNKGERCHAQVTKVTWSFGPFIDNGSGIHNPMTLETVEVKVA